MRILWICGLPLAVQRAALANEDHGAQAAWSWILAHLPPPNEIELHIACLWPGGTHRKTFVYDGATFHLLPCPRRGRALLLFQRDKTFFRALFDELKPEVVHGWGTEDSFGLVARQLAPARHLIGIQGLITAYRDRVPMETRSIVTEITERWTLHRARWVVAESGYSVRAAQPLCPRAEMRIIEHPLRREFLEIEPGDGEGPRVLFLGGINERKGISDALRAFAETRNNDWMLHVIGSGTPEAEAEMLQLVHQVGIQARFQHDRVLPSPEIVKVMQASSVFLLPTRIDTGPTALKEALALGLWPVCYDNTGPGEYVRKFEFGSLARDLDLADLTATLRSAIETQPWANPQLREKLRAETRAAFSRERIWKELAELYQEICGQPRDDRLSSGSELDGAKHSDSLPQQ
jgi:glycosyltransferase involved in cell wall biosynthesis